MSLALNYGVHHHVLGLRVKLLPAATARASLLQVRTKFQKVSADLKAGKVGGMFDGRIRHIIDPTLDRIGRLIARTGVTADTVTLTGCAVGIAGAVAVAAGAFMTALVLILASRVLDGLDGAVARATKRSDRGGFLDITLDFFFYGAVPLAFAAYDPYRNALPAALLLCSFYMNGTAFLAYAIIAAKRGIESSAQGVKSIYYVTGLAEGAETIAIFALCCLYPAAFPVVAALFAVICFASAVARVVMAWRVFRD